MRLEIIIDPFVSCTIYKRIVVELWLVLVSFPSKVIPAPLLVHFVFRNFLFNIFELLEGIDWMQRLSNQLLMVFGKLLFVLVSVRV